MGHNAPVQRPLILINGTYEATERPALKLYARYAERIAEAGGLGLLLPPLADPAHLAAALERADGVLLTGGDDFHTEPLGLGPIHPAAVPTPLAKQEFDLALARFALERRLPVLGICYGMQCLGLGAGARLLQHVPEQWPGVVEHRDSARHSVSIAAGSKLGAATGVERLDVVSRHHQALMDVPAPWVVVGRDPEGLVEAIEHSGLDFAVGVQWHPELSAGEGPHGRLFAAFIAAARLHGTQHAPGRRQEPLSHASPGPQGSQGTTSVRSHP
jgi:putative glutamine amidotransferase